MVQGAPFQLVVRPRRVHARSLLLMVPLLTAAGCEGSAPVEDQVPRVSRDLTAGATGQDVRDVQSYLTRFGYFPSPRLADDYPSWRPIVDTAPANGRYDAATEKAVRALQRASGVPETAWSTPPRAR